MAESALWSGEYLTWPELSGWLRTAIAVADERRAAGDPVAQRAALVSMALCRKIVAHFMGEEWFLRNAMPDSRINSFLYPVFDGLEGGAPLYTARLFNLSECLLQLQYTPNVIYPIRSLADEAQMESGIAELQIGSLLFQYRIPFRYIAPSQDPGVRTPDIELWMGNNVALAEAKCKYEIREYTPGCLKSAFHEARKQIGSGRAGLVFVKVPQKWGWDSGSELMLRKQAVDEAKEYMRRTSRIVKTIFYTFNFTQHPGGLRIRNGVLEAVSPRLSADSPWNDSLISGVDNAVRWLTIPTLVEMARAGNAYYER